MLNIKWFYVNFPRLHQLKGLVRQSTLVGSIVLFHVESRKMRHNALIWDKSYNSCQQGIDVASKQIIDANYMVSSIPSIPERVRLCNRPPLKYVSVDNNPEPILFIARSKRKNIIHAL